MIKVQQYIGNILREKPGAAESYAWFAHDVMIGTPTREPFTPLEWAEAFGGCVTKDGEVDDDLERQVAYFFVGLQMMRASYQQIKAHNQQQEDNETEELIGEVGFIDADCTDPSTWETFMEALHG